MIDLRFWSRKEVKAELQSESAECGLACLVMIENYHGGTSSLIGLRQRYSSSLRGTDLGELVEVANYLGLTARPVRLDIDGIEHLKLPAILHWDLNHYVVVDRVRKGRIRICDPAVGRHEIDEAELANRFSGIAVEFSPTSRLGDAKASRPYRLSEITGELTGLKSGLFYLFLLGISLQIVVLSLPLFVQYVVDNAIATGDMQLLNLLALGFLAIIVIRVLMSAARTWFTTTLSTSLNIQWTSNVFKHLVRLPIKYFEARHLGDISSRFDSIFVLQRAIATEVVEAAMDLLLVVGIVFFLFNYSATLAIISIVTAAIYLIARLALYHPSRNALAEGIVHGANRETSFLETIRGIQTVRLGRAESLRHTDWINKLSKTMSADLRLAKLNLIGSHAKLFLFSAERIAVVWLASKMVMAGQFSVGMLFAYIAYKEVFSDRFASFIDKYLHWRMLTVHADRVADIALESTYVDAVEAGRRGAPSGALLEARHTHDVAVFAKDVSFRYSEKDPFVLREVNFRFERGDSIVVTGPSGSGKTTLIKLILGLYEPTTGALLVEGEHPATRNSNGGPVVASVMQDDRLFAGSIAANISFFSSNIDVDRLHRAADLACIKSDIDALPMGFDTVVGEIGTGFSGGQQQRILLARALYAKPDILVLDEASSHLDAENEESIDKMLNELEMTRIVVAHRRETVHLADRHFILDGGVLKPDARPAGDQATGENNFGIR